MSLELRLKKKSKEVPFKGNVYDFLVDFKIIDKSNILNTRV